MTILTCKWCGFTENLVETSDHMEPCPCCGLFEEELET